MSRRLLAVLALLLSFALVAAACGGDDGESGDGDEAAADDDDGSGEGGDDSDPDTATDPPVPDQPATDIDDTTGLVPVYGGELVVGLGSDGAGFDTTDAVQPGALRIAWSVVESLVTINEDGEYVPYLAKTITPNEDSTVWTFELREGIEFHDGALLDAEAAKANLDAYAAGPTVGFAVSLYDEIVVTGEYTFEVRMSGPWSAYPYTLVGQPGMMVSPATIGSPDSLTGTGPFVFDDWTPDDSVRVVRNDSYWRDGFPYLDVIEFKVIPEASARRAALEADDVQLVESPGDANIVDWLDDESVNVLASDSRSNEAAIILNTAVAPMDDVRVRRALAHAIDQQLIIDTFRSGITIPAKSFLDPGDPFWVDTDYPEFDLDIASGLIAEYEAEVGPVEVTFSTQDTSGVTEVAELIESFWTDIGVDVTREEVTSGADVPRVIADDFQAFHWFQFGSADPDREYIFFHSSQGFLNWSNFVDEGIDAGFQQARDSADPAVRADGYALVQERLADQVPIIWIDHLIGVEAVAAQARVRDVALNETADGVPILGLQDGSFHLYNQIWLSE